MTNQLTFGECLSAILNALNLKCSKLAKDINVDSSLVYKWLRSERVPSYDTPYIELITDYIAAKIKNTYQREAIIEIFTTYGIKIIDTSDNYILSKIQVMLQEAQGYSIKLQNKLKSQKLHHTNQFLNLSNFISNTDSYQYSSYQNDSSELTDNEMIVNKNLFYENDHIQIIKGNTEVIYSIIALLRQASKKPNFNNNSILITFNSEMDLLFNSKNLRKKWINALYDVLDNGWNIIFQIRLNSNMKRTIKLIEDMQVLLSHGKLSVFCHKANNEAFAGNELCIIPNIGALYSISSKSNQQVDRAFWFHKSASIDMMTALFFQSLNSAKSLLKPYPSQNTMEFQQAFAEAEESLGDTYVLKNGLSTNTIPLYLYEKYLKLSNTTNQDMSYRIFLHKKRLDAFNSQVKYYEFKDIYFIESLEKLVNERIYSFDDNNIPTNNYPNNSDIICHLENLISMLQKYDNYEIAFISEKNFRQASNICWTVKGNWSVLIETLNPDNKIHFNYNYYSEKNFIVTEKSIVNAFRHYFLKIWSDIPDENKSKEKSIILLKSLIEICKSKN